MNSFTSRFRFLLLIAVSMLAAGNAYAGTTVVGFNNKTNNLCSSSVADPQYVANNSDGTWVDSTYVNNNPLTPCTGNYKVSNGNPGYDFTLPSSPNSPIRLCPTDSCQTLTFTWTGNLQGKWGSGNSHASLQFCRQAGPIPGTGDPCFYYVLPAEYNAVGTPGGLSRINPSTDACNNSCTGNPIVTISEHGRAGGDVNYFGTPNIQGQVYTYSINSLQFHRALDAIGWGYTASEYYLRNTILITKRRTAIQWTVSVLELLGQ